MSMRLAQGIRQRCCCRCYNATTRPAVSTTLPRSRPSRTFTQTTSASADDTFSPRVANPSIWASLIPKAFRHASDPVSVAERAKAKAEKKAKRSKDWNPATFFIIMSLLIGSNAIQLISLKKEILNYSRKNDAKIALLREVIEKVQKGEDVDVEGMLGTGDPEAEKEWQEVITEIESADSLWTTKEKKRELKAQAKLDRQGQGAAASQEAESASDVEQSSEQTGGRRPGFY